MGAVRRAAGHRRAPARLHLLRGRHAVVPLGAAAPRPGRPARGRQPLVDRQRDHVRVRARHPDRAEAARHPRHGRDAAQPRRRTLRRPRAGAERARAPLRGDLPGVRVRPLDRLPADQHRPDRGHARRDRREVAGRRRQDRGARSGQRHQSTRWSCPSTPPSAATGCTATDSSRSRWLRGATKRRWVDEAFAALERAGYTVGSAYTAVKHPGRTSFVYRDRLWQGADLAGSRGGVVRAHQRRPHAEPRLVGRLRTGDRGRTHPAQPGLPADRRGTPDSRARAATQARLHPPGRTSATSTASTCGSGSPTPSRRLASDGYLADSSPERVRLSREGLLRVDSLLPRFFLPAHTDIRYT